VNLKFVSACALVLACASASDAYTQPAGPQVATPQSPDQNTVGPPAVPPACCKVPFLAAVELEFVDAASSRTSKPGDLVTLRLAEPLVVDGHTIAPAGTKAVAEVIQASKSGLMGKAGELTFAARFLEIGETHVPLKRCGYGRTQGKDPTGTLNALNVAAAAAMPIASVALIFVSGGNVDIKSGARAHAVVATETFVPSNAQTSNSEGGK
jgi:hypothetical protein